MVSAPGEDSIRPGKGMAGEGADNDQRERGERRTADQFEDALSSPHLQRRITLES
jgi:hypothetical protein